MAIFKSKAVTKDGRKWYFSVCYLTANGERKRKKGQLYATKGEAQEAERKFLIDIPQTDNKADMTFEEMYYQYINFMEGRIKSSTKYGKNLCAKSHILPYFGKTNIHNITVNNIIAWTSKINQCTYNNGKKYTSSYKQNIYKELKLILKYGVDFCGLRENVVIKASILHDKREEVIADEDKIRYITPDEYNIFIGVIDDITYKVFFAFLYYMGVRKGEAQALNWEDIFWETNQVRIIKTITTATDERNEYGFRFKITNTKNRKNRTIKMPLVLKDLLLELHNYYKGFEGFNDKWFVFGGYKHLSSTMIHNEKNRYFELVEKTYGKAINRITTHEFRHSHASYLISKGVKIELIANRLGDTAGVTSTVYAHLFPEAEDEIIDTLDLIENKHND